MDPWTGIGEVKLRRAGDRVSVRGRVLRTWESERGFSALLGDATGLTRVDAPAPLLESGAAYVLEAARVEEHAGGWHSLTVDGETRVRPWEGTVTVARDEAYVERVYRILRGVERKRRRAGEAGR